MLHLSQDPDADKLLTKDPFQTVLFRTLPYGIGVRSLP